MKKNIRVSLFAVSMTVAAFLMVVVGTNASGVAFAANFTDVSENEAVDFLVAQGIIKGYEDGTFRPYNEITRAEFTAMLCRAMKEENAAKALAGQSEFSDVKSSNWASGYIQWAKDNGIINGVGAGKFDPQGNVTYEQTVKMIVLAMGYEESTAESKGGYPKGYMEIGQSAGLYIDAPITWEVPGGVTVDKNTRRIVAQTIYNAFCDTSFAAKCRDIIAKTVRDGMTELEKEIAIYAYITLHTEYDLANYINNTIPSESYTAKGVILNGIGVCQGYSGATKLLMNMVGIECMVVSGEADGIKGWEGHAWNIVKINGEYYHIDTTFDDSDAVYDNGAYMLYIHFNKSDDGIAWNHKWEKANYPICVNDMDTTTIEFPNRVEQDKDGYLVYITHYTVLDVVGMERNDAYFEIYSIGGSFTYTYEYNAMVPAGCVISQNPSPGTSMRLGGSVDVVVSRGLNYFDPTKDDYVPSTTKQQEVKFLNIQLEMGNRFVSPGHNEAIQVSVIPNDAIVAWSSSDESIATVNAGLLNVIGVGTVTITATANGKSATLTIVSKETGQTQENEQTQKEEQPQESEQEEEPSQESEQEQEQGDELQNNAQNQEQEAI
jgi:hypothetical protein